MGRACEERWSPRPPVTMSSVRVRVTSGVWRRGMWVVRLAMGRRGRTESKRMGKMEINAKIWWGELKDLDCVFVRILKVDWSGGIAYSVVL